LASASPRRRQLLAQAGYKFTVVVPDIDESGFPSEGLSPCEYAKRLALAKAKNVAAKFPESLVIGADTVVDYKGKIIGKPADAKQAEQITRKLFSKPHKVITAVAIVRLSDRTEIVESDTTAVHPK
jgi:septum formation protein